MTITALFVIVIAIIITEYGGKCQFLRSNRIILTNLLNSLLGDLSDVHSLNENIVQYDRLYHKELIDTMSSIPIKQHQRTTTKKEENHLIFLRDFDEINNIS